MSRIQARDSVFKLIYEYEFLNNFNQLSLDYYLHLDDNDDEDNSFIENAYKGILENYNSIVEIIKNNLEKYTIEKVTKMDMAILVVAVYELEFTNEVNTKIAINEAVELAKKYSNDNSFKFVNGVLARIVAKKEIDG